jgi:hypothetical protein
VSLLSPTFPLCPPLSSLPTHPLPLSSPSLPRKDKGVRGEKRESERIGREKRGRGKGETGKREREEREKR